MKRIFFLVPYPVHLAPSQRFRFEQYFPVLIKYGYDFRVASFLNEENWRLFYGQTSPGTKAATLLRGIWNRFMCLGSILQYDCVFIHREAMPLGPPILEWIIAKILRKKIIYDFDDAIWLTDRPDESFLMRIGKCRSKVRAICRWSNKVSCGNDYLAMYAARFNRDVICNPTVVDTDGYHNPERFDQKKGGKAITIGWTGSHSTLKYLKIAAGALKRIVARHPNVQIVIIADRPPENMSDTPFTFIAWNRETEIQDLLQIDIGIMPLPDDQWAQGKCSFKAIQYMALGIPPVVSAVGLNRNLIDDGVNGFFADGVDEWFESLDLLIRDNALRKSMGEKARTRIVNQYSTAVNASTFLSLFE